MNQRFQMPKIDFTVDTANLYREENLTDMKVASIRRLMPVTADGKDDPSRTAVFVGSTQLMSPEGPLPLQAILMANNFQEAVAAFPGAMKEAMEEMIDQIRELQAQEAKQKNDSRIIVPGR
jgi:hypothetical protein